VNGHARALVLDADAGKLEEQLAQAVGETVHARDGGDEIGMRLAMAVDFDFESVKAGVIDVIGQSRARAEIIQPAAADDTEGDAGLAGDRAEQVEALRRQLGSIWIDVELGDRPIEVEQQYKCGISGAVRHLGRNFRKHLSFNL
jgi:hypothetical protein